MHKEKYSSTKRPSSKKILSFIIVFLVLLFIVILFISETNTKTDIKSTLQKKPITTQNWKMEKDRTDNEKAAPLKTVAKPLPLPQIRIKNTIIDTKKPIVNEITERERAKEALKQQMLN